MAAARPARLRNGTLMLVRALVTAMVVALASIEAVQAVEPDEVLADARLEARARDLSAGLRCLVCQNQSIDDSNAPLARDLRLIVRERLKAGDSDAQVMQFLVARYGDFVLLKPPFNLATILLWLAPLLALVGAGVLARRSFGARDREVAAADHPRTLTADEQAKLDALLANDRAKMR